MKNRYDPNLTSLFLDASGPTLWVGLLRDSNFLNIESETSRATDSLLTISRRVIEKSSVTPNNIEQYIYCSGPGSTLGIRISIMAIKTLVSSRTDDYPKVFHYSSFHLSRLCLDNSNSEKAEIVCSWRKGQWLIAPQKSEDNSDKAVIINDSEIASNSNNYLIRSDSSSSKSMPPLRSFTYTIEKCTSKEFSPVFIESSIWNEFNPGDNKYIKWSGDRHK